ncbi:hypothetical protein [Nonomuraea rubra]|uniref:Uncharacterized protein n=1 Tax=Nonomuraea rubra TaxID=46180 RepID=A0A7X0NNX4_9ACTN|nr:hypothetical protein [Nonomuraea rubra]MBB6546939.1 hypothetical protein [Nonomuraea rubra]
MEYLLVRRRFTGYGLWRKAFGSLDEARAASGMPHLRTLEAPGSPALARP